MSASPVATETRVPSLIRRVITRTAVRRSDKPQWNPRTRWNEKRVVIAFVELEDGTLGAGEAYCDGGNAASVIAIIERDLAPLLAGRSPLATRHLWRKMVDTMVVSAKGGAAFAAASALDIASWDAAGKALGLPAYRLAGGASNRVPAYASAGLYGQGKTIDDLAREMAGYVSAGFLAVKIKVGGAPLAEDRDRVRAVRQAVGPGVRLMVDALYAYGPAEALSFARAVEDQDVHFLEAPVHPEDIVGLRRVCQASPIAVAGNEFAYGDGQFVRLIAEAGIDVVHADAILCGGITGAMRVADLASAYQRPISFHAASSVVCLSANAHAGAAAGNCESVEFHMIHQLLFEAVDPLPFSMEEGVLVLSSAPGLGFDLDPGHAAFEA
jgi:L-alanine-DL-glutamate epimerase-like enolase superfamily enzyme